MTLRLATPILCVECFPQAYAPLISSYLAGGNASSQVKTQLLGDTAVSRSIVLGWL